MLGEELRRRLTELTWGKRTKGDPQKIENAMRLRKETLMTVRWLAERLQMGSVANVNTLLYQQRQAKHKN